MQFNIISGTLSDAGTSTVIVPGLKGEPLPDVVAGIIDADEFTGQFRKTLLVHVPAATGSSTRGTEIRRVLLVGLGRRDKLTPERVRRAIASAVLKVRSHHLPNLAVEVPRIDGLNQADVARATADGVLLASYTFDQFHGAGWNDELTEYYPLEAATVVVSDEASAAAAHLAQSVYGGVKLARDLGNEPPATCTPTRLASVAAEIATRGGMELTVLDRAQIQAAGMGGIIGVAQAAREEPRFIAMEYGQKGNGPTVALVGKGITFDSGGISLKPGDKMDLMKMDMMGAAAVLGTMSALADLKPANLHVIGIVGATENLPGGHAFKPGDILKALNGVTMEILNTDAEGRLVLADCLSYAQRYQPDAIIDLATLTGAVVVGLGNHISGMMTNNHALASRVKQAGEETGELVWELPLLPEHKLAVKSKIADVRNSAGRGGGSIKAGAFLEHFVGSFPWVHLDIAGVAWAEEHPWPYARQGATGYGVRLLTQFLQDYGTK